MQVNWFFSAGPGTRDPTRRAREISGGSSSPSECRGDDTLFIFVRRVSPGLGPRSAQGESEGGT